MKYVGTVKNFINSFHVFEVLCLTTVLKYPLPIFIFVIVVVIVVILVVNLFILIILGWIGNACTCAGSSTTSI